ncbi:MAG: hypothetical protein JOZ14_16760 [Acidobacteria bacterium]|nr:hypothetical protein [Acidobacteriota bacterium]
MPVLPSAADVFTRKLPKLLSPANHRRLDYALAAAFGLAGARFWRKDRRAAMASWLSGASILGLSLITDYPGEKDGLIAFPLHGKIELGLAALIATMPELFDVRHTARGYFNTKAGILTVVSNLTAFHAPQRRGREPI